MNSFANIRGILGVVMKKIFQLYPVARGFGGVEMVRTVDWYIMILDDFWVRHGKITCWRATILEGLVSTKRHGGNMLLIYISFLDYISFYKGF
jgi:hypothetical protein